MKVSSSLSSRFSQVWLSLRSSTLLSARERTTRSYRCELMLITRIGRSDKRFPRKGKSSDQSPSSTASKLSLNARFSRMKGSKYSSFNHRSSRRQTCNQIHRLWYWRQSSQFIPTTQCHTSERTLAQKWLPSTRSWKNLRRWMHQPQPVCGVGQRPFVTQGDMLRRCCAHTRAKLL